MAALDCLLDGSGLKASSINSETALATGGLDAFYTVLDRAPEVEDPRLSTLLGYWRGKRGQRSLPAFRDIDPIDIPGLLSYLWIHDYDPETDRFRCRLMGESVRSAYDMKVTGLDVEEIVTKSAYPVVAARYRAVVTMPAVAHGVGRIYGHTIGRVGLGERLYLPLADDEGRARMIIGATIYRVAVDRPADAEPRGETPLDTLTPVDLV
ncbi:MAG: PAS domain-containing protein [Thalassobaculum sp.]|uniref:PAS domain-containing protein n=1 Tax=Thalassobaculum sp. TaxID=2022740 RepID=UPI0032EE6B5A